MVPMLLMNCCNKGLNKEMGLAVLFFSVKKVGDRSQQANIYSYS